MYVARMQPIRVVVASACMEILNKHRLLELATALVAGVAQVQRTKKEHLCLVRIEHPTPVETHSHSDET